MKGRNWKVLLDRVVLAGTVIAGGFLANHSAPAVHLPLKAETAHGICRASYETPAEIKASKFVPAAANEPVGSLDN